METKKTSGFAGFLDGYTANNIENNSTILKFHSSEIVSLLDALKADIETNYKDVKTESLLKNIKTALDALSNKNAALEQYLNSGLAYEEFMIDFKKLEQPKSETLQLVKKTIYHYLNIAKQTSNGKIEELVKRIAYKY